MARPRKALTERRDDAIPPVRLTGDERLHVERQAAAAGLALSDYCRRAILGQTVTPRRSAADDRLLLEINRIGVNLNQIARAVNMDKDLSEDFPAVMADLWAVLKDLARVP